MKITSLTQISEQSVSHNPAIKKKVMLHEGDLPHLTNFAQAKFAPGQVAAGHFHSDMWEVFFIQSGEGLILIDGEEYSLVKGSCILVEPGEVHEIVNNGEGELILNYFGIKR